ncbi:MAG TPA: hypothetical protein VJ648_03965, partial [Vicinamibacteria bacterium]|nr:hypothetical protein [Vicinamibacteria bacterium]
FGVAGMFGLAAGRHASARDDRPVEAPAREPALRLRGRGSLATAPARTAGAARVVRRLELLDALDGRVVGELVATALAAETAFPGSGSASSGLELQTLRIGDDTLFGMGACAARGGERAYALVGGTGRFAGARGTCVEHTLEDDGPVRGEIELVVTLIA